MNLFPTDDPADVARLEAAGWKLVPYYGRLSWRSPDGRRLTQYTATALEWLAEGEARKETKDER